MTLRGLLLTVVLLPSQALSGQQTTVDVGAIGLRYADTVGAGGISLTPAYRYSRERSAFDASATFSRFASGFSSQGSLSASVFSPTRGPFAAELAGAAGGSLHEDGERTGQAIASARGYLSGARAGLWLGGGVGAMNDGVNGRGVRQAEAGAWARISPLVSALVSVVPTAVGDTVRYVDAQAALSIDLRRASLELSAGVRGGSRVPAVPGASSMWGGASMVAPLTPSVALVLSGGTYPLDFTQGFPAGRYVIASLRFSGGGRSNDRAGRESVPAGGISRFSVTQRARDVEVEIRAPNASAVEITGDFTQWEARALTRVRDGVFRIALPVGPGTYQMNVRIDGGPWLVPPGVTGITDELGVRVGLLIVPER